MDASRHRDDDRLCRLRSDRGQPARRAPARHPHLAPAAARRPSPHPARRGRHRADRRPGRQSDERALLSVEQLAANLESIRGQLGRFLDLSPAAGEAQGLLLDNSDWLSAYGFIDFLRDVGKYFTVNQMIAKESVKSRIERPEQGISFTEFSYMLLQAYDYLHLHDSYGCRLQIGGSDQWGNITMGLELIRKARGDEAFGFTWPLLLRSDGTKFGKTESGAVWLDAGKTSPYQLYQYFVRKPDDEVGRLLRFYTFLSHEEIAALDVEIAARPERREAQTVLARAVTTLVHGEAETERAEAASQALFSRRTSPSSTRQRCSTSSRTRRPRRSRAHRSTATGSNSSTCSRRRGSSLRSRRHAPPSPRAACTSTTAGAATGTHA